MKNESKRYGTLCWNCKKQFGKCAWSKEFKPVDGWKATPTKVKADTQRNGRCVDSFEVHECPEFELLERLKRKRIIVIRKKDDENRYKVLFKKCGFSQKQLSKESGVSVATISRFVNEVRKIDLKTLKKMADALGVEVDELMKGGK